ncbi:hypothetical protein ACFX13_036324 [Malus domestica]
MGDKGRSHVQLTAVMTVKCRQTTLTAAGFSALWVFPNAVVFSFHRAREAAGEPGFHETLGLRGEAVPPLTAETIETTISSFEKYKEITKIFGN